MNTKMSSKMQEFVKEYEQFDIIGKNKLRDLFAPVKMAEILKKKNKIFYLHKFASLETVGVEVFAMANKVYLLQKFAMAHNNYEVNKILNGEYKIGAICQIVQMGSLNIYYSLKTTLFVLCKYGIFEIATYRYYPCLEKADNIITQAYKGQEIVIMPSATSQFAKDFDENFKDIAELKMSEEFFDLDFGYKKNMEVDQDMTSAIYVDDNYVCDIKSDLLNKANIIICYIKINGKVFRTFKSVISEYDFTEITPEDLVFLINNDLGAKETFSVEDFMENGINVTKFAIDSINKIYRYVIDREGSGIIQKSMLFGIRNELLNANIYNFKLLETFDDETSFLGKTYLFGKDIYFCDFMLYNVYVYQKPHYSVKEGSKSILIFVERKNGTGEVEVYTIKESLSQCVIKKFKNLNLDSPVYLPYYYYSIDRVSAGNIPNEDEASTSLNIIEESVIFEHIRKNIKDVKVKIKVRSEYMKTRLENCLKALYDNSNKIKVTMEEPKYIEYSNTALVTFTVDDMVISTLELKVEQKERVAKYGNNVLAVKRYTNKVVEKTFGELGIGLNEFDSVKKC